jgi:hypothetical protein
MITLKYRMPSDIEELEGTSFSANTRYREEQLFFNGIYQVNKIESKFDQGQFTQTLFCTRMNNQQGATQNPVLQDSVNKGIDKIQNFDLEEAQKKAQDLKDFKKNAEELTKDLISGKLKI